MTYSSPHPVTTASEYTAVKPVEQPSASSSTSPAPVVVVSTAQAELKYIIVSTGTVNVGLIESNIVMV